MISKAEATQLANNYKSHLLTRVSQFLRAQAQAGIVGGTFVYTPQDTGPEATKVKNLLEANGWTITIDAPNSQVVIS